jgi:hydrogenase nickel incorporation protein HypA/HybF
MHELAICQALIEQLDSIAAQYVKKQIVEVNLKIGPLSGVVPQLLVDAFSIAAKASCAEQVKLNISKGDIVVRCKQCETESRVKINQLVCRQCGDWQTELVSGDEMLLERVELQEIAE